MSKNKKRRRPMPKTCDPNMCDHCMYLGEGDFVCDLHGLGPEETVFVRNAAARCPRPVTPTCVTIACIWERVTLCVTSTAWGRRKLSLLWRIGSPLSISSSAAVRPAMNRRERRKLQKQGVQVPKDPSINIKLSDLGRGIMTPAMESAMMHEINQQCLEADARFSLDLDTMVLWTLYQCYGWREKRLHDFYLAMAREHRRMREYYQMDDLYPERYKLKEKGIDVEKWQEEVLRDDP